MARAACTISLPVPRITAFNPGASPPPLTTEIVLFLLMISRLSFSMIVPESLLTPEPPVERLLFC
jgi:hypothetical protein